MHIVDDWLNFATRHDYATGENEKKLEIPLKPSSYSLIGFIY